MASLETLKDRILDLVHGTAGRRFQDRYHRVHARGASAVVRKTLFIGGGTMVVLAGIFFLPAPGPGMLIILFGAGMIAQESLFVAKFLDWGEVRGRVALRKALVTWRKMPAAVRGFLAVVLAAGVVAFVFLSYSIAFR